MSIILTKLGSNDVLLGRGTGPNESEGNRKFRAASYDLLQRACSKSSSEKNVLTTAGNGNNNNNNNNEGLKDELAKQLVAIIHSRNGKFVRKLTKDEVAEATRRVIDNSGSSTAEKMVLLKHKRRNQKSRGSSLYVVVPDSVALSKAKQSFRHQLHVLEKRCNKKGDTSCGGTCSESPQKERPQPHHHLQDRRSSTAGSSEEEVPIPSTGRTKPEHASGSKKLMKEPVASNSLAFPVKEGLKAFQEQQQEMTWHAVRPPPSNKTENESTLLEDNSSAASRGDTLRRLAAASPSYQITSPEVTLKRLVPPSLFSVLEPMTRQRTSLANSSMPAGARARLEFPPPLTSILRAASSTVAEAAALISNSETQGLWDLPAPRSGGFGDILHDLQRTRGHASTNTTTTCTGSRSSHQESKDGEYLDSLHVCDPSKLFLRAGVSSGGDFAASTINGRPPAASLSFLFGGFSNFPPGTVHPPQLTLLGATGLPYYHRQFSGATAPHSFGDLSENIVTAPVRGPPRDAMSVAPIGNTSALYLNERLLRSEDASFPRYGSLLDEANTTAASSRLANDMSAYALLGLKNATSSFSAQKNDKNNMPSFDTVK